MLCETCSLPRVLLADDHAILRDGLKGILKEEGFEVVGEAADGAEAVRLAEQFCPDVAVLDISMPLMNGIDAARAIRKSCPSTKIVVLTMHTDDRYVLAGLRAGVAGYVLKSKAASTLVQALNVVCTGELYLSSAVCRVLIDTILETEQTAVDPLSAREREVLQLIAQGKNIKEVGGILNISPKTAEWYRSRIMEKLEIRETAGLTRYAIREGLVGLD